MKEIDKYQELKQKLIENSNPDLAKQMEKYLRNKFKFYGLKSPERRKSYHDLIKAEKKNKKIDNKPKTEPKKIPTTVGTAEHLKLTK